MKKGLTALVVLGLILATDSGVSLCAQVSDGMSLYDRATASDRAGAYITALEQYKQAWPLLVQEGNTDLVKQCRLAAKRLSVITGDYSATEQDLRSGLKKRFPDIPESTINSLLQRIDSLVIEGVRYYYEDFVNTAINLDLSLMQQLADDMAMNRKAYHALQPFVSAPGPLSGTPYRGPVTYEATASISVKRDLLPNRGTLQVWQPVSINSDCQKAASRVSVSPAGYVRNPATVNGDLGVTYLEVPLDGLSTDLSIVTTFGFTHYEQRFTMVDPAKVGAYDKNSELYRTYTASRGSTVISPEIAAKAREVVGGEKNPYRMARKIYDYIVDELTYSHTPHAALEALKMPESVYVHSHRYGDCGAQSIYFSALCRSLGIPARATGGYQLFPGMEGTHFWAEFYLPNYGWVPVDTSVAQVSKYIPELAPAEKQAFKDYYFGSMDPYRWVVQKDVDLPLVPAAKEPTILSIVLQFPAVLCDTMVGIPEEAVLPGYRIEFKPAP